MADRQNDKSTPSQRSGQRKSLPEKAVAPRPPAVRISDVERNRMVEVLRGYCGEGVLTLDEFSDRVGLVFEAKTNAELERVVADLPVRGTGTVSVPETQRRKVARNAVGIMSGARRTGRWRPGEEFNAFALMGGCEIDLRQAEIDGGVVTINATAVMGGIDIIVPDGIQVDLDEFHFMGGVETRLNNVPIIPGSPLIRVKAFALMGSVIVRTKKTRAERDAARAQRRQDMIDRRKDHIERRLEHHARRIEERLGQHGIAMPDLPRALDPPEPPAGTKWSDQVKAAPDGTVTILFSDIVGYTEMTERLGDLRAHERLTAHNEILRRQLDAHGGYEVKSQGDGFMVAFAGASRALRCAIAIQRAFADYCRKRPDEPIQVHIGLNTGEVLKDGDDFLGRTVILASRIAGEAKSGEILTSSVVKALADGSGEFMFDVPRDVALKGVSQPQTVYPVVWQV
jgi:class 3 adenylate cyclase